SEDHTTRSLAQPQDRVPAFPGVRSVAVTEAVPLAGGNRSDGFIVEGRKENREAPVVDEFMTSPGYFQTLGIPLLAGRDFSHEAADAPKVAVVSRSLVERLFPNQNPIGQRITGGGGTYQILLVVGTI